MGGSNLGQRGKELTPVTSPWKDQDALSQGSFLRDAMRALGKNRGDFAARFGVTKKSIDNWLAPPESKEFRRMPRIAWLYIAEALDTAANYEE
jgi:hypothetical protein